MKNNPKVLLTAAAVLLCYLVGVSLNELAEAHGKHRPRATRVDQVRRHGDAKMTKRIAGHTIKEAILRYKLEEIVAQEDIERGKKEMYNFLKWKLGGPGAVAGQYVSSGYDHFEKAYTDEAGGILLGVISFANKEPELVMPKWMQDYLKVQAGATGPAIAKYLESEGVPKELAAKIGQKVAEALVAGVERNVAAFMPKSYDIDNRLVRAAIRAKKAPGMASKKAMPLVVDDDEEDEKEP